MLLFRTRAFYYLVTMAENYQQFDISGRYGWLVYSLVSMYNQKFIHIPIRFAWHLHCKKRWKPANDCLYGPRIRDSGCLTLWVLLLPDLQLQSHAFARRKSRGSSS